MVIGQIIQAVQDFFQIDYTFSSASEPDVLKGIFSESSGEKILEEILEYTRTSDVKQWEHSTPLNELNASWNSFSADRINRYSSTYKDFLIKFDKHYFYADNDLDGHSTTDRTESLELLEKETKKVLGYAQGRRVSEACDSLFMRVK